MIPSLGIIVEALVSLLLVLTIGYCIVLDRRLKRFRADEEDLRATIAELVTATEIAERAIIGLKATASECDKSLTHRLRQAEKLTDDLGEQLHEGSDLLERIARITEAGRAPSARSRFAVFHRSAKGEAA
ncbi:MAG: chemotaxis protein [Hyphomicrobiales bacterium]|nr:chemotaxis protein [Hyphomicrobiales bacterium]